MLSDGCLGTNDLDRAARFYDGFGRYDLSQESGFDIWLGWGTCTQLAERIAMDAADRKHPLVCRPVSLLQP